MSWTNYCLDEGKMVSYYPEMTDKIYQLEQAFLSFLDGKRVFNLQVPSMLPKSVLDKCGYFDTFPQHITTARPIYTKANSDDEMYLTPAACLHFYPMFEKECHVNSCYTTRQRVFRYEAGDFDNPERLWEFTVREMVFVGDEIYVKEMLCEMKEKSLVLAKKLCADAELSVAADCFYPNARNIIMQRIQKANHLKDELVIPYEGRKVAVASFNFHKNHFSKPFHFDSDGKYVSGCVGFGLERWALFL